MHNQTKKPGVQETPDDLHMTERVLWQKIRQGDEDAFSTLFQTYYKQLYFFAGRIVRDPAEAENIVQDILAALWIQKEQIHIKSGLKSYLYTAVKNRALSWIKKNKNRVSLEQSDTLSRNSVASPENIYIEKEWDTAVQNAIARLPQRCRLIYRMKRYDNLKYEEIAGIFNISINTVKTQLQRAFKILEKELTSFLK